MPIGDRKHYDAAARESVTEGTISKWLVSPGDHVHKYDPLCEVLTDKVNAEVPSSFEGKSWN